MRRLSILQRRGDEAGRDDSRRHLCGRHVVTNL